MNKKIKLKLILDKLARQKGVTKQLTESRINSIADSILKEKIVTRDIVINKIIGTDQLIKESIDFGDTDLLIDMIIDLVNNK